MDQSVKLTNDDFVAAMHEMRTFCDGDTGRIIGFILSHPAIVAVEWLKNPGAPRWDHLKY